MTSNAFFHENSQRLNSITSPKSDITCGKYRHKFFYASK